MPFYTPPKPHSFDMDQEPDYIVPVIASFSAKGGVQPLYFQFDNKTIKIVSVHWCEKKFNAFQFECTAELEGYLTEIKMKFFPADNRWVMKPK